MMMLSGQQVQSIAATVFIYFRNFVIVPNNLKCGCYEVCCGIWGATTGLRHFEIRLLKSKMFIPVPNIQKGRVQKKCCCLPNLKSSRSSPTFGQLLRKVGITDRLYVMETKWKLSASIIMMLERWFQILLDDTASA